MVSRGLGREARSGSLRPEYLQIQLGNDEKRYVKPCLFPKWPAVAFLALSTTLPHPALGAEGNRGLFQAFRACVLQRFAKPEPVRVELGPPSVERLGAETLREAVREPSVLLTSDPDEFLELARYLSSPQYAAVVGAREPVRSAVIDWKSGSTRIEVLRTLVRELTGKRVQRRKPQEEWKELRELEMALRQAAREKPFHVLLRLNGGDYRLRELLKELVSLTGEGPGRLVIRHDGEMSVDDAYLPEGTETTAFPRNDPRPRPRWLLSRDTALFTRSARGRRWTRGGMDIRFPGGTTLSQHSLAMTWKGNEDPVVFVARPGQPVEHQSYNSNDHASERRQGEEYLLKLFPERLRDFETLRNLRVLDAGTGRGSVVRILRKHGVEDAWGLDMAATSEQLADPSFIRADMTRMPIADGSLDVIYSMTSVFLYESDEAFLRTVLTEFRRVLRSGGSIRIANHTCGEVLEKLSEELFGPGHFRSGHTGASNWALITKGVTVESAFPGFGNERK
jgi:hypothetical protein